MKSNLFTYGLAVFSFGFCLALSFSNAIVGRWDTSAIQFVCALVNVPFIIVHVFELRKKQRTL